MVVTPGSPLSFFKGTFFHLCIWYVLNILCILSVSSPKAPFVLLEGFFALSTPSLHPLLFVLLALTMYTWQHVGFVDTVAWPFLPKDTFLAISYSVAIMGHPYLCWLHLSWVASWFTPRFSWSWGATKRRPRSSSGTSVVVLLSGTQRSDPKAQAWSWGQQKNKALSACTAASRRSRC